MGPRANTSGRLLVAIVCLLALLLSVLPCAMMAQSLQPAATAGMTMHCAHCCGEHGAAGWAELRCAPHTQPAETAVATDGLSAQTIAVWADFGSSPAVDVFAAMPVAARLSPPPLLHPVLRI